jgi:hypothetical protein
MAGSAGDQVSVATPARPAAPVPNQAEADRWVSVLAVEVANALCPIVLPAGEERDDRLIYRLPSGG